MNILKSIILLLFISSCNNSKDVSRKSTKNAKSNNIETDSVLIPKFEIEIDLSDKAEKKLFTDKESVIVQAMFIGIPKDTTIQDEEYKKFGQLKIGLKRIELIKERVAKFYDCKISKKTLESLTNKNFEVNINVFTGRKSSNDNLINCDFLQKGIYSIKNKRFTLKGKLIYGE